MEFRIPTEKYGTHQQKLSDAAAAVRAVKFCVSPRLRHSAGIPLVSPFHVTKNAAVLKWADRVAHCVVYHCRSALRCDTATIPNIITVSLSIQVCTAQRRFGYRRTWSHKVKILYYNIIILPIVLQLPTIFSTVTCCTGL